MLSPKNKFLRFLKDEDGQSTTEYILILAVVVMIALKFKGQINGVITKATNQVEQDILSTIQP